MNGIMNAVEFDLATSASPVKVRVALIDFSERRPRLWPGLDPSLYEVYWVGLLGRRNQRRGARGQQGPRREGMGARTV